MGVLVKINVVDTVVGKIRCDVHTSPVAAGFDSLLDPRGVFVVVNCITEDVA